MGLIRFSLILFILGFAMLLSAQSKMVEIEGADRLTGINTDSTLIRVATGNVRFIQEGTRIRCDSAVQFVAFNRVEAYGNVVINQGDTLRITSQQLRYNGNTRVAELDGDVRLRKSDMILSTPSLVYYMDTRQAHYNQGGRVVNDSTVLTSRIGHYYAATNTAFFRNDVHLVNPGYTLVADTLEYDTETRITRFHGPTVITATDNVIHCRRGWYDTGREVAQFWDRASLEQDAQRLESDSLFYERENGFGRARGNVVFTDTAEKLILVGPAADYWEEGSRVLATKRALVVNYSDSDSLFIEADTLRAYKDTLEAQVLLAFPNVKIVRSDLQGVCDSLVYLMSDSIILLYHDPVLWNDSNQFVADTVRVLFADEKIDRIEMVGNAFLSSRNDSMVYNQIKGLEITGFFEADSLRRLEVEGNGESVYYAEDDQEGYIGVNRAQGSRLRILIRENKVDRISFYNQPDAKLHPIQHINPADFLLEGFKWYGHLRPAREQLRPLSQTGKLWEGFPEE